MQCPRHRHQTKHCKSVTSAQHVSFWERREGPALSHICRGRGTTRVHCRAVPPALEGTYCPVQEYMRKTSAMRRWKRDIVGT